MANNNFFSSVSEGMNRTQSMMDVFLIAFIIFFIIAVVSIVLGFILKYKESKAIRDAALIKAEADRDAAKLHGAAEVQQAAIRQEEKTLPMLLRTALGKMDAEQAAALVEQMHLNAQSSASQSVAEFQSATMSPEELDAFINDLTSGIGQNVQADANQQF